MNPVEIEMNFPAEHGGNVFGQFDAYMKKIEKTLKKLEEDDFGYCESCGVEIGIRRLEARPTADLCIDCKTLAEIREKQMAG